MRGVTAGSERTNTATSTASSRRESASSLQQVEITNPWNVTSAHRHVFQQLGEVEARVADHRGHEAAARQIDNAPHEAQHRRGERGVPPLIDVAEAEERAVEQEPGDAAPEVGVEPLQDEPALDLFAQSARDQD